MIRQDNHTWHKINKIFKAEGQKEWMNSHTTPIAAIEIDEIIRIYFSTRSKPDQQGNFISNSCFLDVDKNNPTKIIYIHDKPLFELGGYGMFDEFGVMVTDIKKINDEIFLYYAGWQRLGGNTAAYQVMLGLGISKDGGYSFKKFSDGPIMSIDIHDPISIGNVTVLEDDNVIRMYYTSLTEWIIDGKKPTYKYVIKYAESTDGIYWKKTGEKMIGISNGFGVATPSVLKLEDGYHMWFGYRKGYDENLNVGGYLIGYAFSENGIHWVRDDNKLGLNRSSVGWDSKMVCYPSVIKIENKIYMFYCGNGFGLEGIGVAYIEI